MRRAARCKASAYTFPAKRGVTSRHYDARRLTTASCSSVRSSAIRRSPFSWPATNCRDAGIFQLLHTAREEWRLPPLATLWPPSDQPWPRFFLHPVQTRQPCTYTVRHCNALWPFSRFSRNENAFRRTRALIVLSLRCPISTRHFPCPSAADSPFDTPVSLFRLPFPFASSTLPFGFYCGEFSRICGDGAFPKL